MNKAIIGEKCRKARGKKTKYAVAKDSKLTIGQIERIEDGENNYTIDLLLSHLPTVGLKLEVK